MECAQSSLPGIGCPQCSRTSIILEALFNRIHLLENQVSEASADRSAAHRSLYRLLTTESTTGIGDAGNSISNRLHISSGSENSVGSLSSPVKAKASRRPILNPVSNDEQPPLIDLLGPIEQSAKLLEQKTPSETAFGNQLRLSDDDGNKSTTGAKSAQKHNDAEDFSTAYVRHFPKKVKQLSLIAEAIVRDHAVAQPTGQISPASATHSTSRDLTSLGDKSLDCTSSDADSEMSRFASGYTSLNTSFGDFPEPFKSQNRLSEGALSQQDENSRESGTATKQADAKPLHGLDHSTWASNNEVSDYSVILSPQERWAKYCENVVVKNTGSDFKESLENAALNRADIEKGQKGEVAKLNHFRHLDICNICYHPDGTEQNIYRTVVIYNLLVERTIIEVLNEVRGGMILDAKLLDTTSITGSKSVMLTFVEGNAAMGFKEHVNSHGLSIAGSKAHCYLVQVPTRRITLGLRRGISGHGHTRCLQVRNFPRHITPEELRSDLRPYKNSNVDYIESMIMDATVLKLHFLSVSAAQYTFDFLALNNKYRKCLVKYAVDPCARPWIEEANVSKSTESIPVIDPDTENIGEHKGEAKDETTGVEGAQEQEEQMERLKYR